ncbi:MAG: DMT family transporter [Rhodocyclaceae bacterium]|nr:DMT family transporter [Rhodocyclaceae bacterium]
MTSPRPSLRGIALLLLALAFFVLLDATAKTLAQRWPVPLLVWARYTVHCLVMTLFLAPSMGRRLLHSRQPGRQVLRALLLLGTTYCVISALGWLPLAEATAIAFAAPLLVALLARPLLGERIGGLQWMAVLLGFGGVLLIAQPGSGLAPQGMAFALGGAACYALYQIMTRQLSAAEHPLTMLYYTALVGTLATTPLLPWVWPGTLPHGVDAILIGAMGILGGIGHFLLILAFRRAPASSLSPFTYFQLVLATLFGWWAFNHAPGPDALLGMGIIALAGLMLAVGHSKTQP